LSADLQAGPRDSGTHIRRSALPETLALRDIAHARGTMFAAERLRCQVCGSVCIKFANGGCLVRMRAGFRPVPGIGRRHDRGRRCVTQVSNPAFSSGESVANSVSLAAAPLMTRSPLAEIAMGVPTAAAGFWTRAARLRTVPSHGCLSRSNRGQIAVDPSRPLGSRRGMARSARQSNHAGFRSGAVPAARVNRIKLQGTDIMSEVIDEAHTCRRQGLLHPAGGPREPL
jgi:hypothetical protein